MSVNPMSPIVHLPPPPAPTPVALRGSGPLSPSSEALGVVRCGISLLDDTGVSSVNALVLSLQRLFFDAWCVMQIGYLRMKVIFDEASNYVGIDILEITHFSYVAEYVVSGYCSKYTFSSILRNDCMIL